MEMTEKSGTPEKFDEAAAQLCRQIAEQLFSLPADIRSSAYEIRLRAGIPVSVTASDGVYMLDRWKPVTRTQIDETFAMLCGSAVYSRQAEIAQGYITISGGHRAGICGKACFDTNGDLTGFSDISSLCIRIAHEVRGCGVKAAEILRSNSKGIIIAGPPCSGKTTILRDTARLVSGSMNTVVIDERGELAASYNGAHQLDVGCCDVLTGMEKYKGMLHAVRCLSPQVMICDEISTVKEADAVCGAFGTGVRAAASIHCGSVDELEKREIFRILKRSGAFGTLMLLGKPGETVDIVDIT